MNSDCAPTVEACESVMLLAAEANAVPMPPGTSSSGTRTALNAAAATSAVEAWPGCAEKANA